MTSRLKTQLIFILKLALALGLIYLASIKLDSSDLAHHLQKTQWGYLATALLCLLIATFLSSWRWQRLLKKLGYGISLVHTYVAYGKGVTINNLLPGGVVGGDAYKTISLISYLHQSKVDQEKLKSRVVLSVFVDRLMGFWSLSILSLLACALLVLSQQLTTYPLYPQYAPLTYLYMAGLLGIIATPFILGHLGHYLIRTEAKSLQPLRHILGLVDKKHIIRSTFWHSLGVQVFSIFCFSFAIRATGTSIDLALVFAISMGVFTAAALPLSVAGYGVREFVMVLLFPLIGHSPEQGFIASLLFGLVNTFQGLLHIAMWLIPGRLYQKHATDTSSS